MQQWARTLRIVNCHRKQRKSQQRRWDPQFVADRKCGALSRFVAVHHYCFCAFCALSRLLFPLASQLMAAKMLIRRKRQQAGASAVNSPQFHICVPPRICVAPIQICYPVGIFENCAHRFKAEHRLRMSGLND